MTAGSLLVLALLRGAADPDLAAAEAAYDEAHYEEVLPAVRRALQHLLTGADKKRAFELEAFTQAAFDERNASVEAFRQVLGLDPAYEPDASAGPKVRAYWEHARRLGPLGRPPPPPPPPPPARAVQDVPRQTPVMTGIRDTRATLGLSQTPGERAHDEPLYQRWYFWAGAGAAAVAAAVVVGVAVMNKPQAPAGNLGTGALK